MSTRDLRESLHARHDAPGVESRPEFWTAVSIALQDAWQRGYDAGRGGPVPTEHEHQAQPPTV